MLYRRPVLTRPGRSDVAWLSSLRTTRGAAIQSDCANSKKIGCGLLHQFEERDEAVTTHSDTGSADFRIWLPD